MPSGYLLVTSAWGAMLYRIALKAWTSGFYFKWNKMAVLSDCTAILKVTDIQGIMLSGYFWGMWTGKKMPVNSPRSRKWSAYCFYVARQAVYFAVCKLNLGVFFFFFFFFTKVTSSCFEGSSLDRSYLCQERCIPELKEVRVVTPVSHSDKQWQPWLVPAACVCPDGSSERFYIFKCSEKIARIIFDDTQKW